MRSAFLLNIFTAEEVRQPFPWRWFWLLLAASLVVLAARRPEGLLHPQFFAEDASVFFKDAYELPFLASLTKPQAGYHNLIVRAGAEAATILPLPYQPFAYNLMSLIAAAVALSWVALPSLRNLLPSDGQRFALAAMLLLLPNQDSLMKLCYIQWYALWWLCLCCVAQRPVRSWASTAIVLIGATVFFTAGIGVILLPLLAARLWARTSDREEWLYTGGLLAAVVLSLVTNLIASFGGSTPPSPPVNVGYWAVADGTLRGFLYKTALCPVAGSAAAFRVLDTAHGDLLTRLAGAVIVVATLAMLWVGRRRLSPTWWLIAYLIVSSTACFAIRPAFALDMHVKKMGVLFHDRYFFIAAFALFAVFFAAAAALIDHAHGRKRTAAALSLLGLGILIHLGDFRIWRGTNRDYDWPGVANKITAAEKAAIAQGVPQIVEFMVNPAAPAPWPVKIVVKP